MERFVPLSQSHGDTGIFSNLDRKDRQQEVPSQTSGDLLELQKTLSDFGGILTLLSPLSRYNVFVSLSYHATEESFYFYFAKRGFSMK